MAIPRKITAEEFERRFREQKLLCNARAEFERLDAEAKWKKEHKLEYLLGRLSEKKSQ